MSRTGFRVGMKTLKTPVWWANESSFGHVPGTLQISPLDGKNTIFAAMEQ